MLMINNILFNIDYTFLSTITYDLYPGRISA